MPRKGFTGPCNDVAVFVLVNFASTSKDSPHTTFPRTFNSPTFSSSKEGFSDKTSEITGTPRSPVSSRLVRHFWAKIGIAEHGEFSQEAQALFGVPGMKQSGDKQAGP